MNDPSHQPRLGLLHYYIIAGLNACGAITFLMCAFFWTRHRFHFTDTENLLLNALQGFCYIFTSLYGGKLADRWGYDRTLRLSILGMGFVLLLGWIPNWRGIPFVLFVIYIVFMGPTWPALEASVLHTKGSLPLLTRTGIYNMVWSGGNFIGFFSSGFFFHLNPDSVLWAAGGLNLLAWIWLLMAQKNPLQENTSAATDSFQVNTIPKPVQKNYMYWGWLGNGTSYVLSAGFAALTPFMSDRLHLPPIFGIWLACTVLFSRSVAFLILWKWQRWRFHKSITLGGLWSAPLGLSVAFFSNSIPLVFLGLVIFGFSIGLAYSSSLYYSLEYGANKGEQGGFHECVIGMGIFIGPLFAAGVSLSGWGTWGAEWALIGFSVLILLLGKLFIPLEKVMTMTSK